MPSRLCVVSLVFLLVSVSFLGLPLVRADGYWLFGWEYRKTLSLEGVVGAGTNYVVFVVGWQGEGVDGSVGLSGGHNGVTAFELFFEWRCQPDFDDVRFVGSDGTLLDIFVDNENASYCLWAVEVAGNCSVDQTVYCFFGNPDAAEVSDSAATFRRVISSGVVLSLPMNEGAGATLEDYSGNNNDGTITNGDWVTTGKFGVALSFDGAGDYIQVTDTASIQNVIPYTYIIWCNPNVPYGQTTPRFYGKGNPLAFYTTAATGIVTCIRTGDSNAIVTSGAAVLPTTAWTLVSTSLSAGLSPKLHFGTTDVSAGVVNGINMFTDVGSDLYIGNRVANDRCFDGLLSFAVLFNYVLSSDEISDLVTYYPQCSSANLGSLYLRSFVNPEPQPFDVVTELTEAEVASNYALLAGVLGLCGCLLVAGVVVSRRRQ